MTAADTNAGFVQRLRDERRMALIYARWGLYSARRPATIRALGCVLQPVAIADAWYAAECPPRLDAKRAGVSRRSRIAWRVALVLRGASRA